MDEILKKLVGKIEQCQAHVRAISGHLATGRKTMVEKQLDLLNFDLAVMREDVRECTTEAVVTKEEQDEHAEQQQPDDLVVDDVPADRAGGLSPLPPTAPGDSEAGSVPSARSGRGSKRGGMGGNGG